MINLEDDFFGAVLNCAVRYSMGRQSYMPSLVIDFITPLIPYISGKTLGVFKQDYEKALKDEEYTGWNMFGDPKVDKPGWDQFYADVCKEINKRNILVIEAAESPVKIEFEAHDGGERFGKMLRGEISK